MVWHVCQNKLESKNSIIGDPFFDIVKLFCFLDYESIMFFPH